MINDYIIWGRQIETVIGTVEITTVTAMVDVTVETITIGDAWSVDCLTTREMSAVHAVESGSHAETGMKGGEMTGVITMAPLHGQEMAMITMEATERNPETPPSLLPRR